MADGDLTLNQEIWTSVNAQYTDAQAQQAWAAPFTWGLFRRAEDGPDGLNLLGDVTGLTVLEVGCGTAYVSAWLTARGARVIGLDATAAQLQTARRCQDGSGVRFGLVQADGERLPIADAGIDLVVSEYGASVWCDPRRWLPEAARVLRPGGRLVFLTSSVLATLCVPELGGVAGDRLLRPQRDLFRVQWPTGGVEFHPGHGEWIALLREAGFDVEALHELLAPVGAADHEYYDIATADWAAAWPAEDLWVARRGVTSR